MEVRRILHAGPAEAAAVEARLSADDDLAVTTVRVFTASNGHGGPAAGDVARWAARTCAAAAARAAHPTRASDR
jgi:hypothetical protein